MEVVDCYHTTFSNCSSGPCPTCGGMGHIPDGVYNFIGNTIELLSGPSRTRLELERLAEILSRAREQRASLDQVSERIQKEIPEMSSLRELLPKTRSELYSFIAIIITVIGLILGQIKQGGSARVTINEVVNVIYQQQHITAQDQVNDPKVMDKVRKKVGRNDPCPCGSGKKYKKCCLDKSGERVVPANRRKPDSG